MGPFDMRPAPALRYVAPFGLVIRHQSREYTRPVDSLTWQSGELSYDPLGAGVVSTRRLNIFPVSVGQYQAGAIYWNTTPSNQARLPTTGPIFDPKTARALLGDAARMAIRTG